jgi:MFS family permease
MAMSGTSIDRAALRVVLLSSLGGALEFFDFIIFGTFAADISRAFFPSADPLVSLLGALAAFGVGYAARPIGGLVFGTRGDRSGRRHSFLLSLSVMSGATIAMACVPPYAEWGVAATILFVALRLVQGFCLGGELPGAITYAVEVVPPRRVTLACGIVFGCVSSGVLLATGISLAINLILPADVVGAWGWRIAFVIGGLAGIASWALRRSMEESPAFLLMRQRLQAAHDTRAPLRELFARYRGAMIVGLCATGVVAAFNGLLFAQTAGYLIRALHYPPGQVITGLNVASLATSISLVIACWAGDMIPRRYIFQFGCVVIAAGAFPAYAAMARHSLPLPLLFLLIGLAACATHGTFAAILADLFPTEVRFSGVAMTMNISAVIFSGFGPLVATWLIAATGDPTAPGYLILFAAALSFVFSFALPRTGGWLGTPERRSRSAARLSTGV